MTHQKLLVSSCCIFFESLHALCFEFECCVLLSGRDDVRAPIPQKQDILVEPEPLFGGTVHIYTSYLSNPGVPELFLSPNPLSPVHTKPTVGCRGASGGLVCWVCSTHRLLSGSRRRYVESAPGRRGPSVRERTLIGCSV